MNLTMRGRTWMVWVFLGGFVLYGCDSKGDSPETTKPAEQKPEMSTTGMAKKQAEPKTSNAVTTSSGLKYEILREGT